ncbi:MAG: quinone-dependent dihydroorotate dehydrogenase [Pseudomonadota bacterium]
MFERFGLTILRRLDPERSHDLAIQALRAGLGPRPGPAQGDRLAIRVAGMDLANPIGLAAGFDKNAEAIGPLRRAGFGFLEVGAATPEAQPGNSKPRLFRLTEDGAAINRFGFNNDGMERIAGRLTKAREGAGGAGRAVPVGLNLGANKDSADRAGDYARVLARCGASVDFATVNVSSPNTEKLRDLQGAAALRELLERVMQARAEHAPACRVFLKIAPDLNEDELGALAETALASGIDGLIATNTTLARDGLASRHRGEAGGLSGRPLFERSTRVLAQLSEMTDGRLPLIGVGGVSSAAEAYAKICAGASAVQLYTALVYGGMGLVTRMAHDLDERLAQDGYGSLAMAVASRRGDWL